MHVAFEGGRGRGEEEAREEEVDDDEGGEGSDHEEETTPAAAAAGLDDGADRRVEDGEEHIDIDMRRERQYRMKK